MKKLTAIILICVLIMVGCGNSDSTGNEAIDGDLSLESNQSLVIAQVTAIYGNEITLAIAEKVDNTTTTDSTTNESGQNTSDSDISTGTDDTSSNQKDSSASGAPNNQDKPTDTTTPSVTDVPTDTTTPSANDMTTDTTTSNASDVTTDTTKPSTKGMSADGAPPSRGDMPTDANGSIDAGISDEATKTDDSENKSQTEVTRYTLTGEEMTATIPVGTPVTTLLGTVTTFSRIAIDNTLQIVTETNKNGDEVIVAIYIVG
jgi:cytoskeletal protein RodZ